MSLKAKIEAVIYASEEPVTLAQLVGLLGHEAQAELDQIAAAQQSLELEQVSADADTLNSEILAEPESVEEEIAASSPLSEAVPAAPAAEPQPTEPPSSEAAAKANDAPVEAAPDE